MSVCLFVIDLVAKETTDETSELVPACQRAKKEFKDGCLQACLFCEYITAVCAD